MNDIQKLLRIYLGIPAPGDGRHRRAGVALAISQPTLATLGWFAFGGASICSKALIHRFIFHAPAPQRQFLFNLLYRLHYGHHDHSAAVTCSSHRCGSPADRAGDCRRAVDVLPVKSALIAVAGAACAAISSSNGCPDQSFQDEKGRLGRYVTRRHAKHHNIDYRHWFTVSPAASSSTVRLATIQLSTGSCRTC